MTGTPFRQQTRPSSQAPCTPPEQVQPSLVHGWGAQLASAVHVPGPPGMDCPAWQQTNPSSQLPCTPPLQAQPSLVQGGLHSASVRQVPEPPGVPEVPQQTSPESHGDCVPVAQVQP